jgi:hypothetical protein
MKRSLSGGVLLLACAALGCNPGSTTGSGSAPQTRDSKPAVKDLPVVGVDQVDLAKEWKADAKAVQQKYSGKRVEVSGVVWLSTSNNAGGQPMVILQGSADPKNPATFLTQGIQCMFPAADEEKVNGLAAGQKVKVRGTLGEFGAGVPLLDCELAEAGTSTAVKATVDQLVADFKASKQEAEKKYDQKSVLVEAPVADVQWDAGKKRVTFVLEGKDGAKVEVLCECDLNEKLRPRLEAVKKGDTIKVMGQGQAGPFDPAINLRNGKLLK